MNDDRVQTLIRIHKVITVIALVVSVFVIIAASMNDLSLLYSFCVSLILIVILQKVLNKKVLRANNRKKRILFAVLAILAYYYN